MKIKETRQGSYEELYIANYGIKNIIRTNSKNKCNSNNYMK